MRSAICSCTLQPNSVTPWGQALVHTAASCCRIFIGLRCHLTKVGGPTSLGLALHAKATAVEVWAVVAVSVMMYLLTLLRCPRGPHFHVVGLLRFFFLDINEPSLPTPFNSVLVTISVFMAFSTVFYSINSPDNSPLSHSVLPVLFLPFWSFQQCISP